MLQLHLPYYTYIYVSLDELDVSSSSNAFTYKLRRSGAHIIAACVYGIQLGQIRQISMLYNLQ